MNQTAYIAAAVKTLFQSHPTLPGKVPGGLIYGLEPAPVQRPFASMLVFITGEPQYMTGLLYAQSYTVVVRAWSDQFLSDAGSIQSSFETLLTANTKLPGLVNGAWTLHISQEPAALEEQEQRLFGQFNFVAGGRWLVQLQQQRG